MLKIACFQHMHVSICDEDRLVVIVQRPRSDCPVHRDRLQISRCGRPVLDKRPKAWRATKPAACICERGTAAQSAGGANRRGLDAWRSGQETGWCTEAVTGGRTQRRERLSKPSWGFRPGQHPDCLSHGNQAVSKFTAELRWLDLSLCDAPLIEAH